MKFTSQQYAQALYDAVSQTNPKDHDVVLDNFVKILAQNGELSKHQEIEKEYHILEMKEKGIKQIEITVAKDIEVNKNIIDELNKVVGASFSRPQSKTGGQGQPLQVDIKKKVDEGIVGGVIVRVDDTLIDASIKTQLENLNQTLKS